MLHLVTFGGLALESVNEAVAPRLSAQRLAILAVLAAEGDRRVSRERLTGMFWPDSDEERARHSLRQALYATRNDLGREVVRSDFALSLDPSAITSDVRAFRAALARRDRVAAASLVRGPFLAGFYLPSAPPFQRWAEEERARLHTAATAAITSLATEAMAANELDAAVSRWRQLTELDPLSGRFALGYLKALAARGDRVEALDFARQHTAVVRRELETEPDSEIQRLEASLRSAAVISTYTEGVQPGEPTPPRAQAAPAAGGPAPQPTPAAHILRRRLTRLVLAASVVVMATKLVRDAFRQSSDARASTPPPTVAAGVTTRSATAYRLYQEGLRAYYRDDLGLARQMMRAALEDDSTFAMAAYYDALVAASAAEAARAIRLAASATERERLLITTDLQSFVLGAPSALVMADTLASRYPNDARALAVFGRAKWFDGDWSAAARALERAIAIDSAALDSSAPCYVCGDLAALIDVYSWWDSVPAAVRAARRYTRVRPDWTQSWERLTWASARAGDTAAAYDALRRVASLSASPRFMPLETRIKLLLDQYDGIEQDLRVLLESPKREDFLEARWWLVVALRNQGRLRDARRLMDAGTLPGLGPPQVPNVPDDVTDGVLALERGDARAARATYVAIWNRPLVGALSPGQTARYRAWRGTLAGMMVAATGDTAAVVTLADSVQYWGARSIYGRDRRAHHYLRGLVHAAAGRDDDAIRELRSAIHSPSLGFTRVNLELGRALLRRNRPREAAHVIAPALRGEIDASNLYVTRTELHELLAQAYDGAGEPDSAAAHYRVVVRAWANADPVFHARRETAKAWLAANDVRR